MATHFGLDIGSFSIKAVRAERKGKNYKLVGLGEVRTPADLNSQAEADKRAIIVAIKNLVAEAKINTKDVALSLSEISVYSQVVELPYLSETELSSAINFEAEQYIPVPLEEVELEYLILSTTPKGTHERMMEILLVAAKKHAVEKIVELTEAAGLAPLVLETEILSLIRIVNLSFTGDCLFLNLGHSSTNIIILQGQTLKFTRTLNTSGEALTRVVAQELNMDFVQAEQYKSAYGLDESALEGKLRKAILPTFNVILTEITKARNFVLQKQPGLKISTLIVSGGGSSMPGLNSYLAQSLNLEVITFDPFRNFIRDERLVKIKGRPRFSTAVGLAVREG